MNAKDVKPNKWSDITLLFDNGWYSIIHGWYEGGETLGERWNGENGEVGYPNFGRNPLWYVVPKFLWISVLEGALVEMLCNPYDGCDEHRNAIVNLISQYRLK